MRIAVSILALLFAALHFIAGLSQYTKSKDPAVRGNSIAMVCGGASLALAAATHLGGGNPGWMEALSAGTCCVLICAVAVLNGKRSGNFHLSHHIVRGAVAALLVVGFALW